MTTTLQTQHGDVRGPIVVIPDHLAEAPVNIAMIHEVVVAQQAAARQGTHSTKRRGEVSGGGRKPHPQKGTGRARQGSTRAPHFVGGGIVHGPHPRSYAQRTNKKVKAAALLQVLGDRYRHGRIAVLNDFGMTDRPATKIARLTLEEISTTGKFLVILERNDRISWLSLRNLPNVHIVATDQLNVYDVLRADHLVFTKTSFANAMERVSKARQRRHLALAEASVAPTFPTTRLIHIDHEDADAASIPPTDPHDFLNASARRSAVMPGVHIGEYTDESVVAKSFSSEGVEPIAVEAHTGFVLASWPSTMTAEVAIAYLQVHARAEDPSEVSVYAGAHNVEFEYEDGEPVDWARILEATDSLTHLRLELADETLMWRRADEDETTDRFVAMELTLPSAQMYTLMRETAGEQVVDLAIDVLGDGPWVLAPLPESA